MNVRRNLLIITALSIICVPVQVRASRVTLNLARALALADRNDLGVRSARLDVEAGDAQVRQAYAAALPRAEISGSLTHFLQPPSVFIPSFGRLRFSALNDLTANLQVQQPLYLAGKVGLALDAARTYRGLARESLSTQRAKLKSAVIREYYGLVLAREVVRVTNQALEQAIRHVETAKRMMDAGMASEFDYLRAKVEAAGLEPELLRARQGEQLAEEAVKSRLGLASDDSLVLTESLDSATEPLSFVPSDEAYQMALQSRPEFRALGLQRRLGEINLKAQVRSLYWPNLVLALNYRQQAQDDKMGNLSKGASWTDAATWTLGLQIPLFDGFSTQSGAELARIGIRRVDLSRSQLEQGVRMEVTAVLGDLERSRRQVEVLKDAVQLAERALEIANTRYENGLGTELEVADAQLALHRANLGYLQGLYEFRVAQAEYARVVTNDDAFPEGE